MKIAIIASPWVKLPAKDYTGIAAVISSLCEKLIDAGEQVILFAPHGSTSSADILQYPEDTSGISWNEAEYNMRYFYKNILAKYAGAKAAALDADVIHNFTLAGEFENSVPSLYTVYGPPTEKIVNICRNISRFTKNYMVTVSNRQRVLFNDISSDISFTDTVYKSIDTSKVEWSKDKEDYFLFLGHESQKQELELARRVSDTAGKRLIAVIQGKKEQVFKEEIKPWLDKNTTNLNMQFTDNLLPEARYNLYRKAKGTFHINQWEDPFGMEMLESLAAGTPLIALRKGAAPEVIKHNKTGFIVETESEMVEAIKNIDSIDPAECRKSAEEEFSAEKITHKYLEIYKSMLT